MQANDLKLPNIIKNENLNEKNHKQLLLDHEVLVSGSYVSQYLDKSQFNSEKMAKDLLDEKQILKNQEFVQESIDQLNFHINQKETNIDSEIIKISPVFQIKYYQSFFASVKSKKVFDGSGSDKLIKNQKQSIYTQKQTESFQHKIVESSSQSGQQFDKQNAIVKLQQSQSLLASLTGVVYSFSFMEISKQYSTVLTQNNIEIVHEKTYCIIPSFRSVTSNIMVFEVHIFHFKIMIEVYNVSVSDTTFDQFFQTNGTCIGQGGGGKIYSLPNHQGVLKKIQLQKNYHKASSTIKATLFEFAICKLLSCFSIGAKIIYPFKFDILCTKNSLYFFMEECLKIQDAFTHFDSSVRLTYKRTQQNLKRSLYFLHQLQLIHYDIKPQNIMYSTSFKKAVFIDFGLTQYKTFAQSFMERQSFKGTYFYCCEQMKQLISSDKKEYVDVYFNDVYCLQKTLRHFKFSYKILKNQVSQSREDALVNERAICTKNQYVYDNIFGVSSGGFISDTQSEQQNKLDNQLSKNYHYHNQIGNNTFKNLIQPQKCQQKLQMIKLTYFIYKNKKKEVQRFISNHSSELEILFNGVIQIFFELDWNFSAKQLYLHYFLPIYYQNDISDIKWSPKDKKQKICFINLNNKYKKQLQTLKVLYMKSKSAQLNQTTNRYQQVKHNQLYKKILPSLYDPNMQRIYSQSQNFQPKYFQDIKFYLNLHDYMFFILSLVSSHQINWNNQAQTQYLLNQISVYLQHLNDQESFTIIASQFRRIRLKKESVLKIVNLSLQSAFKKLSCQRFQQIFTELIDLPNFESTFLRVFVPTRQICSLLRKQLYFEQFIKLQLKYRTKYFEYKFRLVHNILANFIQTKKTDTQYKLTYQQYDKIESIFSSIKQQFNSCYNLLFTAIIQSHSFKKIILTIKSINQMQLWISQVQKQKQSLNTIMNLIKTLNYNFSSLQDFYLKKVCQSQLLSHLYSSQIDDEILFYKQISQLFLVHFLCFPDNCPIVIQKAHQVQDLIERLNRKYGKQFTGNTSSQDQIFQITMQIKYKCYHQLGNYQCAIQTLQKWLRIKQTELNLQEQTKFFAYNNVYYQDLCSIYKEIGMIQKRKKIIEFIDSHLKRINASTKVEHDYSFLQDQFHLEEIKNQLNNDIQSESALRQRLLSILVLQKAQNKIQHGQSKQSFFRNSSCLSQRFDFLVRKFQDFKVDLLQSRKSLANNTFFQIITEIHVSIKNMNSQIHEICLQVEKLQINSELFHSLLSYIQSVKVKSNRFQINPFMIENNVINQYLIYEQQQLDKQNFVENNLIFLTKKQLIDLIYELIQITENYLNQLNQFETNTKAISKDIILRGKSIKLDLIKTYIHLFNDLFFIAKSIKHNQSNSLLNYNWGQFMYCSCLFCQFLQFLQCSKRKHLEKGAYVEKFKYYFEWLKYNYKNSMKELSQMLVSEHIKLKDLQFLILHLYQPLISLSTNKPQQEFKQDSQFNTAEKQIFISTKSQIKQFYHQIQSRIIVISQKKKCLYLINQQVKRFGTNFVLSRLFLNKYLKAYQFIHQVSQQLQYFKSQQLYREFYLYYVKKVIIFLLYKHSFEQFFQLNLLDKQNTKYQNQIISHYISKKIQNQAGNKTENSSFEIQKTNPLHQLTQMLHAILKFYFSAKINQKRQNNVTNNPHIALFIMSFCFQLINQITIQRKKNSQIKISFQLISKVQKLWKMTIFRFISILPQFVVKRIITPKYFESLELLYQMQSQVNFEPDQVKKSRKYLSKQTIRSIALSQASKCKTIFHNKIIQKLSKSLLK